MGKAVASFMACTVRVQVEFFKLEKVPESSLWHLSLPVRVQVEFFRLEKVPESSLWHLSWPVRVQVESFKLEKVPESSDIQDSGTFFRIAKFLLSALKEPAKFLNCFVRALLVLCTFSTLSDLSEFVSNISLLVFLLYIG